MIILGKLSGIFRKVQLININQEQLIFTSSHEPCERYTQCLWQGRDAEGGCGRVESREADALLGLSRRVQCTVENKK